MERTDLALHIRKLREDYLKQTQEAFSKTLGVSRVAISRYEIDRVPKRTILAKLLDCATKEEYIPGAMAFARALGGRWELKPSEEQLTPVEEGRDEALFNSAIEIYAYWSALKPYLNTDEAVAKRLASSLEGELKDLIEKLHRVVI